MRKPTVFVVALVSVWALLTPLTGLEAQTTLAIDLDVDCDDVELRSLVRSYFSRDLRELGGIRVAETSTPDYRVAVIAVQEGRRWVMSVVIEAPFSSTASATELDPDLAARLADYSQTVEHWVGAGNSNDRLGDEIAAIVRSFDRDVLKERRGKKKRD